MSWRNSTIKLFALGAVVAAACGNNDVAGISDEIPTPSLSYTQGSPLVVDMIAGGGNGIGTDVGDIVMWNDATNLYVKYVTSGNWTICGTHLSVKRYSTQVPQANGNPIPGQFQYKNSFNPCVTEKVYTIPVPSWSTFVIAAHADVRRGGTCSIQDVTAALPATADVCVTTPVAGGSAYFPQVTITNGGILNGLYGGWCVDLNRSTSFGGAAEKCFLGADVRSTVGPFDFSGMLSSPGSLDLLNWVLNQNYIGQSGPGGPYTYGDVQRAIWSLVEAPQSLPTGANSSTDPYSEANVAAIVAAATAGGEGFMPGCGQKFGVIIDPKDGSQPFVIPFPVNCTCGGSETAWGKGLDFPGSNWAMYISYTK